MLAVLLRRRLTSQRRALSSIPVIDLKSFGGPDFKADSRREVALQVKDALSSIGFMYVKGSGLDDAANEEILSAAHSIFSLSEADKKYASMDQNTYKGYYNYIGVGTQYETFAEDDVLLQASNFDGNMIEAFQTGLEPDSSKARNEYYNKRNTSMSMRDITKNKWPKSNQNIRTDILEGMQKVNKAAFLILKAISVSLDLNEDHLSLLHDKCDWSYEMKKYSGLKMDYVDERKLPPFQRDVQQRALRKMREEKCAKVLRVRTHTDLSSVSLLIHTDEQSLEILHNDTWIPAPKIKDAILVNTGNIMEMWTGCKYKSTKHRVVSVVEQNANSDSFSCQERSSFVCFVMPNWDVPILSLADFIYPDKQETGESQQKTEDFDMFGDIVPIQQ